MDAVVVGNVTLDIICQTVNDVPRHDSIAFDNVTVSPGGCGSNVAIGLCSLGVSTALVARVGDDAAYEIIKKIWQQVSLDERYVKPMRGETTGVSVGLVDEFAQPRFIHTPGANALLTANDIDSKSISEQGVRYLHIAGYFVLPGLINGDLADLLYTLQGLGVHTSLDVVRSPRMKDPKPLWNCIPFLDVFLCNAFEGERITGKKNPV
ncbi:MAG TPA: carbohydrate kinase family protein, partial [Anaerolineales bacterium]|nr:carbohydrate kinase family protein [Anaerolineales bacterium]